MNKGWISMVVGACLLGLSAPVLAQTTENYSAMSVCKFTAPEAASEFLGQGSIFNYDTVARRIICPLKQVYCASGSCQYSANIYVSDGNNATGTDSDVVCKLGFHRKNEASLNNNNYGSSVTHSSPNYTLTYKTISVTSPGPDHHLIFVECSLPKKDPEDFNVSYLTWIEATYP